MLKITVDNILTKHELQVRQPVVFVTSGCSDVVKLEGLAQNLRTLDALQLAAVLELRGRGLVTQFVCADQRLCAFAVAEGLSVVNPELP